MCLNPSPFFAGKIKVPIYKQLEALYSEDPELFFGDYTVVSPNYSDLDFAPELLRKVTTSKLIYSHAHFHHIWRGESLEMAGEAQYNAHMKSLVSSPFFRGEDFSWADGQFHLRQGDNSGFGAASMIKFVVNAHIEFMVKTGI